MMIKKALLIYVEPTPYILDLIFILRRLWPADVDVLFMKENVSQVWELELDGQRMSVLPVGLFDSLGVIRARLASNEYGLLHLAGWAPLLMLGAMVLARYLRILVTVETDTPLPVGISLWKRAVKRLFYPLLFSLPNVFFPGGKRQATYLRSYGVSAARIVKANMTVDVTTISRHVDSIDVARREKIRRDLDVKVNATVFLYVGRMEPHKGLQELIGAFGRLPASATTALLLVGDGSMRDTLMKAVVSDPRICWTGRLSGTALLDAYATADVFVLASRFEPWGLVVNEAMAAGLPIIATDRVGCVDDLILEGVTGLVVPSEAVTELAAAMSSLCENQLRRKKMAWNGRNLISGWTLEHEAEIIVSTWKLFLKN